MPDDEELKQLAAAYLRRQRELWPDLARKRIIPEASDDVIAEMLPDFKRRHRGTRPDVSAAHAVRAIVKALGAFYGRFSCDNSNPKSIQDQLDRCLLRAAEQKCFVPWEFVYSDFSISGLDASRQGYSSLKSLLKSADTQLATVYVDDFTRASRSDIEWWYLAQLCKNHGKRLVGASDNFDLESPNADIMIVVFGLVSRLFVKGLRQKVMRGMRGAVGRGGTLGKLPLGYTRQPKLDPAGHPALRADGRPRYERCVDPNTKKHAQELFDLFVDERLSVTKIAKLFNARKVDDWSGWTSGGIKNLLTNPIFIGVVIWNRRRNQFDLESMNWRAQANPMTEWEYAYEPLLSLVSLDKWLAAQERIAATSSKRTGSRKKETRNQASATTLLSGTMYCGHCGTELTLIRSTRKYKQMGCKHGPANFHDCKLSSSKSTRVIESAVVEYIARALLDPASVDQILAQANEHLKAEIKKPKSDSAPLEKKLKAIRAKVKKLIQMVEDEQSEQLCQEYHARARALTDEAGRLESELRRTSRINQRAVKPLNRSQIGDYLADLRTLLSECTPAAAAAIRALTGQIMVTQEKVPGRPGARWILKFAPDVVQFLAHMAKKRDYPDSITLEYLNDRKWITPEEVTFVIERCPPKYEGLAPQILRLREDGVSLLDIAARFGVNPGLVSQALKFAKTGCRPKPKPRKRSKGLKAKESVYEKIVDEVGRLRHDEGMTFFAIGEQLGVSTNCVRHAYASRKVGE